MSIIYSKLGIPVTFYDHFRKAIDTGQTIDISVRPKKKNSLDYQIVINADGAKKEKGSLDIDTFRLLVKANPDRYSPEKIEHFYFTIALQHAVGIISSYKELANTDVQLTINQKTISESEQHIKSLEERM